MTPASARRLVAEQHARRDESFLDLLERAVYGGRDNPYRALLAAADIELGDVRRLIDEHGLEGALRELHDAGVYVTLDEFKGRTPIERGGVVFRPTARPSTTLCSRSTSRPRPVGRAGPGVAYPSISTCSRTRRRRSS